MVMTRGAKPGRGFERGMMGRVVREETGSAVEKSMIGDVVWS